MAGIDLGGGGLQSLRLHTCTPGKFFHVLYTVMDDVGSGNKSEKRWFFFLYIHLAKSILWFDFMYCRTTHVMFLCDPGDLRYGSIFIMFFTI